MQTETWYDIGGIIGESCSLHKLVLYFIECIYISRIKGIHSVTFGKEY